MLSLLNQFAALSLAAGMLMTLIPEGSMRKTAGMAVGLMMLLCWSEGVSVLLRQVAGIDLPAPPETALSATGFSAHTAWSAAAHDMLQQMEAAQ